MDLQAVVRGKLGVAYAKQYEQGYQTALADARMAAMRVSFGLEQVLPH